MTDITKCSSETCTVRTLCWRWLAPDGEWQSYFNPAPDGGEDCPHFWQANGRDVYRMREQANNKEDRRWD